MNEITVTIRNKNKETKKGRSNKNKQTSRRKHKPPICAYCGGTGRDALGVCRVCHGNGRRPSNKRKTCPSCQGTGHSLLFGMPCRECGGWGYLNK